MFKNDTFFCPVNALKKYMKTCPIRLENDKPLFRTNTGANYTGRDFNKDLAELTKDITEGSTGVIRSHSFRSGLATEMGLSGFSDSQIMATGLWLAMFSMHTAYYKLPRSKRLNFLNELIKKVQRNRRI